MITIFQMLLSFFYQNWEVLITSALFSTIITIGFAYLKEKKIQIHKIQFEKEFRIYEELWGQLNELKESLKIDFLELHENCEEYDHKRNSLCTEKYYKVSNIISQNKPFLHSNIYKNVDTLLKAFSWEDEDTISVPKNPCDLDNKFEHIVDSIKERINL